MADGLYKSHSASWIQYLPMYCLYNFSAYYNTCMFFLSLKPLPPPPIGEKNPPRFSVDNHLGWQERLTGGPTPNAVNGQQSSAVAPSAYKQVSATRYTVYKFIYIYYYLSASCDLHTLGLYCPM